MHLECWYYFIFARPAIMWLMVLRLSPFPLFGPACRGVLDFWGAFCFFWLEAFAFYFVEQYGCNQRATCSTHVFKCWVKGWSCVNSWTLLGRLLRKHNPAVTKDIIANVILKLSYLCVFYYCRTTSYLSY